MRLEVEVNTSIKIPDILEFIKKCVLRKRILWTYHVNIRMKDRFISRDMVLKSVDSYEILESNPKDKYLPSYLVYCRYKESCFHVLFAVDIQNENVRVVTAYLPDLNRWVMDLKRRKL